MLYTIIGIIAFYTWIHSIIIIGKKIEGLTKYEKPVLIVGLTAFILLVIGSLTG